MTKNDDSRNMMLTEERRAYILKALQQEGRVLAADLSKALGVSDDTIRRDLDALAEMDLLRRVHGGALPRTAVYKDFAARQTEGTTTKDAIARATVTLIRPHQVVILDGGTTSLAIAQHLPRDLVATVITTSPPVAVALAVCPGVTVIMIGGTLYRYAMVAVGADAVVALRDVRADVCVLGVLAIHPDVGISVLDHDEALVKRAMIAGATQIIAPATADKLGTVAPFVVGAPSVLTHLVTERGVGAETLAAYRAAGMTIVQA